MTISPLMPCSGNPPSPANSGGLALHRGLVDDAAAFDPQAEAEEGVGDSGCLDRDLGRDDEGEHTIGRSHRSTFLRVRASGTTCRARWTELDECHPVVIRSARVRWGRSTPISSLCAGVREPSWVTIRRSGAPFCDTVSSYSMPSNTGPRAGAGFGCSAKTCSTSPGCGRPRPRTDPPDAPWPTCPARRCRPTAPARPRSPTGSEHLHRVPCGCHCLRRVAVGPRDRRRRPDCGLGERRESRVRAQSGIVHRGVPDAPRLFPRKAAERVAVRKKARFGMPELVWTPPLSRVVVT